MGCEEDHCSEEEARIKERNFFDFVGDASELFPICGGLKFSKAAR